MLCSLFLINLEEFMFKKIIVFCCLSLICQASLVFSLGVNQNEPNFVNCSDQLKDVFTKIQQLPEANHLINTIQKEGPISIKVNTDPELRQFGAFWDQDRRIIFVNVFKNHPRGALIGTILFELHNALVNSKMEYLDHLASIGHIAKEDYVRSIEYLEYQNSLKASKLAEKGIKMGIFPSEALLPTYRNFEEHYYFQKIGKHSDWIANNFDHLCPF